MLVASRIKWALASRWDDNLEGNGTLDLIRCTHCVELDTVDRIHVGHHTDEVDDGVLDNDDL